MALKTTFRPLVWGATLSLGFIFPQLSSAVITTWNPQYPEHPNDWAVPENWNNGVPTSMDTASFTTNMPSPIISTTQSVGEINYSGLGYNIAIQSPGNLSVAGTGISNSSANTQNFTIDGVLSFQNSAAITGNVAIANNSGGLLDISGLTTTGISVGDVGGAGNIDLGSKQLTVGSLNANNTISGVISGTGTSSLRKIGTGTLTLSGANTYTGGTTLREGTVAVSAESNLGDGAGDLVFDGGALQASATFETERVIKVNAGGGTFNTMGSDLTINAPISGVGSITKSGAGNLLLGESNTKTYSGKTTVSRAHSGPRH